MDRISTSFCEKAPKLQSQETLSYALHVFWEFISEQIHTDSQDIKAEFSSDSN